MKKSIFVVAAFCFLCSSALADDYCDMKYSQYISKLRNTKKIMENRKKNYLPYLEKAYLLCQQDKVEEARRVMDDLQNQFFHDALTKQREFFGN